MDIKKILLVIIVCFLTLTGIVRSATYFPADNQVLVFYESGTGIRFQLADPDSIVDITDNFLISSLSANIELTGVASISATNPTDSVTGIKMGDCDGDSQALGWDLTLKRFFCGDDDSGGGSAFFLDVYESGGTQHQTSSISFDSGMFDVSYTGSQSYIRLDWVSAGGPASLSQAETITGNWVNTANPWADNEVVDALTISGGAIGANTISGLWTGSASISANMEFSGYSSASKIFGSGLTVCAGGQALRWATTGLFSCGTFTGGTGLTLTTDDFSFNATELEAITWGAGGNASNVWTFNLSAGDPTLTWTQSGASLSLNFETIGYASASQYFGAGLKQLGGTDGCSAAGDTLNYFASTGKFSCGTDLSGGASSNSLNFDELQNPLVLDTNITVASGAFTIDWGNATFKNVANPVDIQETFLVQNIPTTRPGAASSSTGYEYSHWDAATAANTFAVATTSFNFAITMSGPGQIRGCSIRYGGTALPTTGGASLMIIKNNVLLTGKYCRIANFAVNGNKNNSVNQNIPSNAITFVAGDRFGIVSSSSGLNAATTDGRANIIFELDN